MNLMEDENCYHYQSGEDSGYEVYDYKDDKRFDFTINETVITKQ